MNPGCLEPLLSRTGHSTKSTLVLVKVSRQTAGLEPQNREWLRLGSGRGGEEDGAE